jgi:hypothetical protein
MRRSYLNAGSKVKHIFEPREVFFDSCIDEYFVLMYTAATKSQQQILKLK